MKLFITLTPALLASVAKKEVKNGDKSNDRGWLNDGTVIRDCTDDFSGTGGSFLTTNNGRSGTINVSNYPNNVDCSHKITADSSCEAIVVTVVSSAVENCNFNKDCACDEFRYNWIPTGSSETQYTPGNCHCVGKSRFTLLLDEITWETNSANILKIFR